MSFNGHLKHNILAQLGGLEWQEKRRFDCLDCPMISSAALYADNYGSQIFIMEVYFYVRKFIFLSWKSKQIRAKYHGRLRSV